MGQRKGEGGRGSVGKRQGGFPMILSRGEAREGYLRWRPGAAGVPFAVILSIGSASVGVALLRWADACLSMEPERFKAQFWPLASLRAYGQNEH